MGKAARAVIIENGKMLVMQRNKNGQEYFTLVGGRVDDNETVEQALVREIKEETGLTVTAARLVFVEKHPEPYNEQHIFVCQVAPHEDVVIQPMSEEGQMNRLGMNTHTPFWADLAAFGRLPFRTPQLQQAIVNALQNGFPAEPVKL